MRVRVWTPDAELDAESLDLSIGGLLLALPDQLLGVGTLLELEFIPPGQGQTFRLVGEVARIADPGGIERPSLVGVRFLDSQHDKIFALAELVERRVLWLPCMASTEDVWHEVPVTESDPALGGRLDVRIEGGRRVSHRYATALSPTALFVRTEEQLPDGTMLELELDPMVDAGARVVSGQVVTSIPEDSPDGLLAGIGIDLGPRAWIVGQRPIFTSPVL